ncbi:hypothetical protein Mp_1g23140 [Marchantia polymorpha subsp. ruderalis]|uniref:Alcohol dehydrogenase-like N-terminal domain-containing protein n=2 Tax=Marchantia polymorpha TaxID=3197 RepID=A0AAF6ATC9_MARPO|nr:hypothetical protein MARPO_0065s0063 [Marchantia polymorpha]BBM99699.1 hypothetical protein Mp_1g23140 [Marchantia polymorpha subsp. ruderalis]|eukprot:PTQ36256.1 hypothetical protein MARPO_0065s0063 [Marchantia polymorpha]
MARALKMSQVCGDPYEVVRLIHVEKPKPGPGPGTENGVIPGTEGFGLVEEVGEGVTGFSIGQRVVPCLYAKYLSTGTQDHCCTKGGIRHLNGGRFCCRQVKSNFLRSGRSNSQYYQLLIVFSLV